MDEPPAYTALRALDALVGDWIMEARPPGGEPWPANGRTTFTWHDSGAHLIMRSSVDAAEAPDSTSIIGCDAANGTYYQLYSDDRGVCRVYEMSIGDGMWKLWRTGPPFAQRFVAVISADGTTMTGRWETAEDATNYAIDFELTYRRVPTPTTSSGHR